MRQKTAIIIHGWDGNPNIGWFAWLEGELKKRGYRVIKPTMPNPAMPKIGPWVRKLTSLVKNLGNNTILIGHSIGCQTILRYLETSKAKRVKKVIFVAGWLTLKDYTFKEFPEIEADMRKIAKPWLIKKIDFAKIRKKFVESTYIVSRDDPYVTLKNASIFRKRFGSKIILENGKKHFYETKTSKIPVMLKEL